MALDQENDDKQDVAIIPPDGAVDEVESDQEPRADDFEAMKKRFLLELPDQEIEVEAIHTWDIQHWRNLERREHSPVFHAGDYPWRILFFPYGNNVDFASFYLEHGFEDKQPPNDWYACVQFMLVLWNPNDPSIYVSHAANHRFTAEEGDWGFTRFAELRKLFAPSWEGHDRPLVEGNSAKITAYVRVLKDPTGVLWHNFINYDSKKETGMVGLKNQGATCYLNSLLQSLYFTTAFRKAVYQIPTEEEADVRTSAYALQRLFYQLQTNNNAVSTQELTAAFGWDTRQIFEQQDVQELSRVLMEKMEAKMKGTEAENALAQMFAGKTKTYISCINVDYESSKIEDFWDIQLNVRGNKNLDDSLRDYVQVETMDGENKYFAEGFGLQDAKKGIIFENFPQVLHLQLKRFEYDINRDAMMKVNDRYEFPEVWDASPYLSENADRSEPYIYHLHGVLVHSGEINAGHYYAFLKTTKGGDFFKFDDERVTRATRREALEENYGGDYAIQPNGNIGQRNPYTRTWSAKRSMSAYMLVYLRESRLDSILLKEEDVIPPAHLATKFAEERAILEKRRKEREEAHLYMDVQVATDESFRAHQGFDLVRWDEDPESGAHAKAYRVLRSTTISEFMSLVAKDMDTVPNLCRPWVMVNRQNRTVRPDQPIDLPNMTLDEVAHKYGTKSSLVRLWIEQAEEKDADGKAIWKKSNDATSPKTVLLFLKHFDIETQSLHGVGHFYVQGDDKIADVSSTILKMMNWPAGTPFKLYEEIKQSMIEALKPKSTFSGSEIQDGDIIAVQKSLSDKEAAAITQSGGYVDVKEFYNYLLNRISVQFQGRNIPNAEDSSFSLYLSKLMSYDQFAVKVAEKLNVDPTHLRFTTVNATNGRPKTYVKRLPNVTLGGILSLTYNAYAPTQNQRNDALYYEILEMSLSELEMRKNIKITWLSDGLTREETFDVLVPKNGIISDIIPGLQRKANLSEDMAKRIRVYEVHSGRILKTLPSHYTVASINDFIVLYAEKIPDEELEMADSDQLLPCFHFDKDPSKTHNVPFYFIVKEGETFKDTKERLSKRTGIKGPQFQKIKFALVPRGAYTSAQYLSDDDILSEKMLKDDSLGLDHVNKTRNAVFRGDSIFIR